ncbi:MAG: NAD(P)/FAD-dependent oxidoreductase [Candidatus Thermoplasmatota archaeon]|nr:NAD(P)/FAD-dependent oxidoreductase [Candidatus Thermoplasmatota archaeon]
MDNLLGHAGKTGAELCTEFREHLDTMGIEIIKEEVQNVAVSGGGFIVDGEEFTHLILATGTLPKKLDIPGALYYLEPEHIVRGEDLLIIGSGDLAFDNAVRAAASGVFVTVLRRKKVSANETLMGEARSLGVKEVVGEVTDLLFDGRIYCYGGIKYNKVAVFVGRTPDRTLLQDIGEVNVEPPCFSTSVKGLYIVGDAALGRFGQTALASGSGLAAAMHIMRWVKER